MDDRELIEKIREGEQDLYAEIVRKYQHRIYQLCAGMLLNGKEAEDAAQEIFIKAFYALDRFQGKSSLYTWLYRIASNYCLDQLRKKSRRPSVSWDELLEKKGSEIEKLLLEQGGSEAPDLVRETVQEVLSFLPADQRLILTLREVQGLSYEEMTAALHCSLDAVKGRLKRARQDFRERFRHFLETENV